MRYFPDLFFLQQATGNCNLAAQYSPVLATQPSVPIPHGCSGYWPFRPGLRQVVHITPGVLLAFQRPVEQVEERLEMAGLIVFIRALLRYCADSYQEVRFRFEA
jgi:hypothetical protein